MKIINKSRWNTSDLKKLSRAVLKHYGYDAPRLFKIVTGKSTNWRKADSQCCSGRASLGGSRVRMMVPKSTTIEKVPVVFPVKDYARVLIHEVGHNAGLVHKEMVECRSIEVPEEILEMTVRPKEKKVKPKRDLKQERYQKTLKKVGEYETKLKRTKTLLKKWKRKRKYYEKGMEN